VTSADIAAVAFMYLPTGFDLTAPEIDLLSDVNQRIHRQLLDDGNWYFHQFSLPDNGQVKAGAILHPLRFIGCNLRIELHHMAAALEHVVDLGHQLQPGSATAP
jgi:L-2,4-diaminobutyrate decarboxylase